MQTRMVLGLLSAAIMPSSYLNQRKAVTEMIILITTSLRIKSLATWALTLNLRERITLTNGVLCDMKLVHQSESWNILEILVLFRLFPI